MIMQYELQIIFIFITCLIPTVLQGMIDGLPETGRCYGMVMNVEKTKEIKVLRDPYPLRIIIDHKQL